MTFVLDASSAAAFVLPDEAPSDDLVALVASERAVVTAHWPSEVANAVLSAHRSARIGAEECEALLATLVQFEVEIEQASIERVAGPVASLARDHGLTVYDAAYLELALREGLPLATLDARLGRAARDAGVVVLQ